ncbi:predicted protein [Histoplasma capsulatum var. duboisii H88]|uniref:Predicted protein n=1 Tax=Ajellomyces capsulatus (strain H88) TaxID=544711 RepID=F0UNC1_AJEC8|nr:predicted protein [Histoplasma capsulatum var. duboisii H88]
MTHQQRRCPAPIYQISANPSSCSLHPSHNKRTLLPPACDNVQKPVISLRGQRVVRQFVARPTTSNPSLPRSRKRTAWPGAVKQGVGPDDEEDRFMATVFLQFCCRRKDSTKPPDTFQMTSGRMTSSKLSPPASPSSSVASKSIGVPMAPPQPASNSPSPPIRIPVDNQKGTASELDSEWKPKIPHRDTNPLMSSEAFRYLSLFQKSAPSNIVTDNGSNTSNTTDFKIADENGTSNDIINNDDDTIHPRPVPIAHRSSASVSTTGGQSTIQVPSLAHSPTTSAASSLLDSPTEPAAYMATTTHPPPHLTTHHQRPSFSPRHNVDSGMNTTRNFDLVMPYIIADPNDDAFSTTTAENEKKTVTVGSGDGSYLLRQENIGHGKVVEHSASICATRDSGRDHGQRKLDCED